MIKILKPDDWHYHFRADKRTPKAVEDAKIFNRVLVMPNDPEIITNQDVDKYSKTLMDINPNIQYIMTKKLTDDTKPKDIDDYTKAYKLYPTGATTASNNGVSDPCKLFPVFSEMEEKGVMLLIHAEDPDVFILDREKAYIDKHIRRIVNRFPGLRVVIEHLSTAEGVDFVKNAHNNVAATITAHHLNWTLNDVVGYPHRFCHPICKTPKDRCALVQAALFNQDYGGKFFYGSDYAPHLNKHDRKTPAGVAIPGEEALKMLSRLFDKDDYFIKSLEFFTSINGAKFYKMPITTETIEIE